MKNKPTNISSEEMELYIDLIINDPLLLKSKKGLKEAIYNLLSQREEEWKNQVITDIVEGRILLPQLKK